MRQPKGRRRILAAVLSSALLVGCHGFDQKKFDSAFRAGKALKVEVDSSGGASTESTRLLRQFQTEVSVLEGRATGQPEEAAVRAFRESADAYNEFLRFRELDMTASVNGRILLMGTLVDVATRYQFPVQTEANEKWVNSSDALRLTLAVADSKLAESIAIVNGHWR